MSAETIGLVLAAAAAAGVVTPPGGLGVLISSIGSQLGAPKYEEEQQANKQLRYGNIGSNVETAAATQWESNMANIEMYNANVLLSRVNKQ
jgi:hypothetical protein